TYLPDQKVVIGVANDSENLYLMLRTKEAGLARAIRSTSLDLWLSFDGKDSKSLGLRFSGGPSIAELMEAEGRSIDDLPEEMRERIISRDGNRPDKFMFVDKKGLVNVDVPTDGSRGPSAAYAHSKGFYVYEFALPLAESDTRWYGAEATPGIDLNITAVWGDRESSMRPERASRESGMDGGGDSMGGRTGGMGGRSRGGMGGRGSGEHQRGSGDRRRGGRQQRIEKQELTISSSLAVGE
ncbi:MAG: hypothetical protein V3T31_06720, partial [candidate division Zixibacteria bacterium]